MMTMTTPTAMQAKPVTDLISLALALPNGHGVLLRRISTDAAVAQQHGSNRHRVCGDCSNALLGIARMLQEFRWLEIAIARLIGEDSQ